VTRLWGLDRVGILNVTHGSRQRPAVQRSTTRTMKSAFGSKRKARKIQVAEEEEDDDGKNTTAPVQGGETSHTTSKSHTSTPVSPADYSKTD
jgi:hypothetical protein